MGAYNDTGAYEHKHMGIDIDATIGVVVAALGGLIVLGGIAATCLGNLF